MRLRNKLAAGGAAALAVGALLTGAGGTASATTSATITSVAVSQPTVALDALNTLPVTWTVHINDPGTGGMKVTNIPGVTWWYPRLILQQVSGTGQVPEMQVSLCPSGQVAPCPTSTGIADGDWTGTIQVPSTASGVWKVAGIWVAGSPAAPTLVAAPAGAPTLTVTGLDIPALSVGYSPSIVHYQTGFSFKGALYDSTTGANFFGVVNVGTVLPGPMGDQCFWGNGHGPHEYFAKQNGYLAPTVASESRGPVRFCLDVLTRSTGAMNSDGMRQEIIRRLVYPPTFSTVGGQWPVSTPPLTAKTGTTVIVNGQALPAAVSLSHCTAVIEYLVGRSAWRLAGPAAGVRSSGRITLTYRALRGRNLYKVLFPACGAGGAWLASTSRPVGFTGN